MKTLNHITQRLGHLIKWFISWVEKSLMAQANNNHRESNKPYIIVKTTDFDYVIPPSVNVFIDHVEKILKHYPNQRIRLENDRVLCLENITPFDVKNFSNLEYAYWVAAWNLITSGYFDLNN